MWRHAPESGESMKVALIVAIVLLPAGTLAQPRARESAVLWQARSCVGESGVRDLATCVSMAWVHMSIAERRGISVERVIRSYSFAVKPEFNVRNRWIFELDRSGRRPVHWRGGSWRRFLRLWRAMLAVVADTLDGRIAPHCYGARAYGSATLDANPNPRTLEVWDCLPGSRQRFYRRRTNDD